MVSFRRVLSGLGKLDEFLSQYHHSEHPARFEKLVCEAFAALLYLPLYDTRSDNASAPDRVTWYGEATTHPCRAPSGPDGIARAHCFSILIEATLKTTEKQWTQEFAQCLRHIADTVKAENLAASDLYAILVTPEVHHSTYNSVRTYNPRSQQKILIVETQDFYTAVKTSQLAFTVRHIEIRKLLLGLLDALGTSHDLADFRSRAREFVQRWQRDVLELEKETVLAVKSYEAMVKNRRNHVGVSEILILLNRSRSLKEYFRRIRGQFGPEDIQSCLLQEGLGAVVGRDPQGGEVIFCPVSLADFEGRCKRRLQAVKRARL